MNLRVNLIFEHERRDCRVVTFRFIAGLGGSLAALALATILGGALVSARRQAASVETEQWAWDRVQETYAQSKALSARRRQAETFFADLQVWSEARREWHETLSALAAAVPGTLQLTEIRLTRTTVIPPAPVPKVRRPGEKKPPPPPPPPPPHLATDLQLTGRTSSPTANADVACLRDAFASHPLSNGVSSAVIPPGAFRQDPSPRAAPADRIFEIVCTYEQKTL